MLKTVFRNPALQAPLTEGVPLGTGLAELEALDLDAMLLIAKSVIRYKGDNILILCMEKGKIIEPRRYKGLEAERHRDTLYTQGHEGLFFRDHH